MTTAEGWTAAVRDRLSPGRLLPLGTTADGAWITERAVREELGRAASAVRGVVPGALRIRPADTPEDPGPGGLLVTASFGAIAGRPLPELVEELRAALLAAAEGGLGLVVGAVDLRVAELLDTAPPGPDAGAAPPPGPTSPATDDPVALAALGVAGVAAVTDTLGPPVRRGPDGVRVELAVTAGARPLDVARAVRTAVTAVAPEDAAVTVVVSDLR
ncbi:hypothetical protein J3A78_001748 [Streptomyces sp. PvR006]|uniref:hypothetical protein n=1 Tax=unclassified Streptomyces TaxID=2593676 RepID=UPI001AEAEF33|nr:hypothetical protein [Streptomyces sp. PvR006]MBP2581270.1 hypothetical protein [Streptomyces sp. PvR006]